MKATLTATLKHEKTGAVETAVVEVTTGNGDSRLFHLVGHMASALHAFHNDGWSVEHVKTAVADAPPGFFPHHQQQPQKEG